MGDLYGLKTNISQHYRKALMVILEERKITLSRLVAIAIEHEFERPNAFEYDCSLPDDNYVEYAYVDEAGKILKYMSNSPSMSLDLMCLVRHDMGIPDRDTFLLAFRECVEKGFLESCKPPSSSWSLFKYDETQVFYRLKDANTMKFKKARRQSTKYEIYQKLKKEFKDE